MAENDATRFLELSARDPALRDRLGTGGGDDQLFTSAVQLGKERGLTFTAAELQGVLSRQLGLTEVRLGSDAGPGNCHSRSGCRSPCVYCEITAIDPGVIRNPGILRSVLSKVTGIFKRSR